MRTISGSTSGVPYKGAIADGQIGCCCDPCPADSVTISEANSAISACTAFCISNGTNSMNVNTFTIPSSNNLANGGPGAWGFNVLGAIIGNTYLGISCAGAATPFTADLNITVGCSGGLWSVTIAFQSPLDGNPVLIFSAQGTGTLPKNIGIPNSISLCSSGPPAMLGSGGLITLTW